MEEKTRKRYTKTLIVIIHLVAGVWVIDVIFFMVSEVRRSPMSTYYVKNHGEKKLSQSLDFCPGCRLYIIHIYTSYPL